MSGTVLRSWGLDLLCPFSLFPTNQDLSHFTKAALSDVNVTGDVDGPKGHSQSLVSISNYWHSWLLPPAHQGGERANETVTEGPKTSTKMSKGWLHLIAYTSKEHEAFKEEEGAIVWSRCVVRKTTTSQFMSGSRRHREENPGLNKDMQIQPA